MTDGLIGLSSAAVLAVYAVGYLHTQHASGQGDGDAVAPDVPQVATDSRPPQPQLSAPSNLTPTPVSRAATAPSYKDGTYVGTGSSRHGDIEATVVIKDGAIVSAAVSRCMTRYTCAYVTPLVHEVVSTMRVPVDHVSGATDSSTAYKQAVKNALNQAV